MQPSDFDAVFKPRSIAVIGASSDPMKFGGRAYLSVRDRLRGEKLYAVNPNVAEIDGVKTYGRLQEIEGRVDFAMVAVPAPFVVQAVSDCAEKGVRAVEILTAGFSETGTPDGARWEREIAQIASRNGMRVVGPNCFGVYSPESPLTILPGPDFPREGGPVGLFAQSGGFTSSLTRKLLELGIRFSKAVSYGNACDLNEVDFLSYFRQDETTRIVTAYIEGVRDGRGFFEELRRTTPQKPVVIWKGGLTGLGSRAVASHTASLAGSGEIWEGLFRQSGAIPVVGDSEMTDLVVGLTCLRGFHGRRVSIVGGGGAITVAAADALERAGLEIHEFPESTRKAIRAHLPPTGNSVRNPVDVGSPAYVPKTLKPILEAIVESDVVDAVIVEQMVLLFRSEFDEALAQVIPTVQSESGKPFIVTLPQTSSASHMIHVEETRRKYREWYLGHAVAVFDTLEQAAGAIGKIVKYNEFASSAQAGIERVRESIRVH